MFFCSVSRWTLKQGMSMAIAVYWLRIERPDESMQKARLTPDAYTYMNAAIDHLFAYTHRRWVIEVLRRVLNIWNKQRKKQQQLEIQKHTRGFSVSGGGADGENNNNEMKWMSEERRQRNCSDFYLHHILQCIFLFDLHMRTGTQYQNVVVFTQSI